MQASLGNRIGSRWNQNAAVTLLNDYDFLLQALFADQSNISLITHKNARAGNGHPLSSTNFEKLVEIWNRIHPHRILDITGDNIEVLVPAGTGKYPATNMSDGERATFYLIGQTLTAAPDILIIFDEPELHIHRSIMSRLWDELEAARPDCGMVFISHDLEFVASRKGQKFVLRSYDPANGWVVEAVPEDTGFTEEITTLILGSRKPILFVEGQYGSLDRAIYRACFPDWTIVPRNSCEEVIHAVVTMRANAALTRVTCAGVVDADAYDAADVQLLQSKGIAILPVSEIENLLLLPNVIEAILAFEGHDEATRCWKLAVILDELFEHASNQANQLSVVMRYCRRRIDRTLKKIDLSGSADVDGLASNYAQKTSEIDVSALAKIAADSIQKSITEKDAYKLLKWYDNKGVLAIARKAKGTSKINFEQWVVRALQNNTAPNVTDAIRSSLPQLVAS